MDETFPPPIRLPGQPEPPREVPEERRHSPPKIVDEPIDAYGAGAAAAALAERLEQVRSGAVRVTDDGIDLLAPPFTPGRDRVDGPQWARSTLVVFGAHGTPSSRLVGRVLAAIRTRDPATVAIAWRHFPDPAAHPRAAVLALAAEAAAAQGRFWAMTRELLSERHHDPAELSAAMVRAGLDPARTLGAMRAGTGADRIVADTASALASAVVFTPRAVHRRRALPGRARAGGRVRRVGAAPPTARPNLVARRQGRKAPPVFDFTEIRRVSLEIAGPPIRHGRAGSQPVSAPSAVKRP